MKDQVSKIRLLWIILTGAIGRIWHPHWQAQASESQHHWPAQADDLESSTRSQVPLFGHMVVILVCLSYEHIVHIFSLFVKLEILVISLS